MPRASWKGFLRLSLVSCPIYLSPATTRSKPVRLHQVWQPRRHAAADDMETEIMETEIEDEWVPPARKAPAAAQPGPSGSGERRAVSAEEPPEPVSRVRLRPHHAESDVEIAREEVLKGYEFEPGRFVTFTQKDLKALDVESSRTIDLSNFVPRAAVDPIYLDVPYYVYPDGAPGLEPLRVIAAAMAEKRVAGIGRVTISRRERMALLEPRGSGMVLITLRTADEVRPAQFSETAAELDADMVAIAGSIIERHIGAFDPAAFVDRYQQALRELVEAKLHGRAVEPVQAPEPSTVIDLMAALKRSLAAETGAQGGAGVAKRRPRSAGERRQSSLLLPVNGGRAARPKQSAGSAAVKKRRA